MHLTMQNQVSRNCDARNRMVAVRVLRQDRFSDPRGGLRAMPVIACAPCRGCPQLESDARRGFEASRIAAWVPPPRETDATSSHLGQ